MVRTSTGIIVFSSVDSLKAMPLLLVPEENGMVCVITDSA
ncbi:hypothetical protein BACDOR_01723 [Phocaeicola dorei DSM 17855]|uniref:Uncharacterized protein n=1 Tax=Phocaeicola dorei DSM 17855 TaxID=483217 RepID=B6VX29_9BACT|nr:hypothetical protein BACDOR_01723 [Phocaeicola dorei DSM 17855]